MNIKHEKAPGQLQEVTIEINKEDYAAELEAALKKQRRTAHVPGFRPGNAPMGMIKKMYEKTLLVQEIDNIVNKEMDKFMKDNEVRYIFEPLPVEGKSKVNFDEPDHFEFVYEYALAPDVKIDYAKLPKVVDFTIVPTAEDREGFIKQLRERHGNYITPETIEAGDSVSVKYGEDKEGFFFMHDLTDAAQKKFIGKKKDEAVQLSLRKAFTNEAVMARFLKVDAKDLEADNEYKFKVTIKHIGRIEPAELNDEFFKKAYPDGNVKNEKELNAEADKVVTEQYQPELNRQFMNDAIEMLIDNVKVDLPDDFIKRYILLTQKDMTAETLEEKYNDYKRAFQWQILEGKLVEGSDIKVEMEDVKNYFREYFIKNYFGNFNMNDVKDRVEELVKQSMENREYVKNVYDMLFDRKLTELLRSKLNIDHQKGDIKAYVDMLTARADKSKAPAKKTAAKKTTAKKVKEENEETEEKEVKAKKAPAKKTTKTTKASKTTKE
jgi:trigger factor